MAGGDDNGGVMTLTPGEVARRLEIVGFEAEDAARVRRLGALIADDVEALTDSFFDALAAIREGSAITDSPSLLRRARDLKRAHLRAMFSGRYDAAYVEERLELGMLYAKAGLPTRVFLGAFHHLLAEIGRRATARADDEAQAFEDFASFMKVAFFDVALIADAIVWERERVITRQQHAIMELSTPVLRVRDRLLVLPVIGAIDPERAKQLTGQLLASIRAERAKAVVLDVTGVPVVDTAVANHLVQAVLAARLMGATAIVTGISSEVAQSLVTLGVRLDALTIRGDLEGGLEAAAQVLSGDLLPPADGAG